MAKIGEKIAYRDQNYKVTPQKVKEGCEYDSKSPVENRVIVNICSDHTGCENMDG